MLMHFVHAAFIISAWLTSLAAFMTECYGMWTTLTTFQLSIMKWIVYLKG